MKKRQTLTIIIPFFNESDSIFIFISQLKSVLLIMQKKIKCKVLFVNNGSSNTSLEALKNAVQTQFIPSLPVGILTLTRNFGYETALIAGLSQAKSNLYCFCDSDGEDPVELIPQFFEAIEEGFAISVGSRGRRFEPYLTQIFRKISYSFLYRVSDDPFIRNAGNFSMFTEVVKKAIIKENRFFPFIRATFSRSGFSIKEITHDRNPRISGNSKFRKLNLLKFALAGFLTTTTWPLRFVAYASVVSLILLVVSINFEFSILVLERLIYFEFFVFFSIISIYLARIYKNILNKPLYYIDWSKSVSINKYSWNITNLDD